MVRPVSKGTVMKTCQGDCKRTISREPNFYVTDNIMFKDGRIPFCKRCIKEMVDETDINSVKNFLRQVDKPLIIEEWKKCMESDKATVGWYLRQISSLHQYKGMTYEDSNDREKKKQSASKSVVREDLEYVEDKVDSVTSIETEDGYVIEITPDIVRKWGSGYSNSQYIELEQTWYDMMRQNKIETVQHKNELKTYCKLLIKRDMALENDEYDDFSKLSQRFNELVKSAGFRPIDKVSGTDEAGLKSFGQITAEVEKDGFIEPAPYTGTSQDIIDKTIMYLLNYQLKLHNMQTLIKPPSDTPKIDDNEEENEEEWR